jgi:hypothetical protein
VTAIPLGGANPGLVANPSFATPFRPRRIRKHPSAHSCVSTAIAYLIEGYFGTPKVHFMLDSLVLADGVHSHVFDNTNDLYKEVFWARIYAGLHFYHSVDDETTLGRHVARQILENNFQRVGAMSEVTVDTDYPLSTVLLSERKCRSPFDSHPRSGFRRSARTTLKPSTSTLLFALLRSG